MNNKALIRLRECAGWSAPLLFASYKSQDFLCLFSYDVEAQASWPPPGYVPAYLSRTTTLKSYVHLEANLAPLEPKTEKLLFANSYKGFYLGDAFSKSLSIVPKWSISFFQPILAANLLP